MSHKYENTDFIYRKMFGFQNQKKKNFNSIRNVQRNKKTFNNIVEDIKSKSILLPNDHGYIIPEYNEKTYTLTQDDILSQVDKGTINKVLNLKLDHGPYHLDFSPNGRFLILGGEKGHLALISMQTYLEKFDISVKEKIRDVQILHNHTMMAVGKFFVFKKILAQKKYVHIYDNTGAELYILRDRMTRISQLSLPSCFYWGIWSVVDISTGSIVSKINTKKGPCEVMCQNRDNAVIHLGHTDGQVTLRVPNIANEVVNIMCHKGPVTTVSVHKNYMVTSGFDGFWKIWDLRNYKEILCKPYFGSKPPSCSSISQTGILSLNFGGRIEFYNNLFNKENKANLYLKHLFHSQDVNSIKFQPYEDICAVGTTYGMSTLIVPGSGEANFDSMEQNPYETGKIAQDREVQRLIEKLPPDSISLNPIPIGSYSRDLSSINFESEEFNQEKEDSKKKKTRKRGGKHSAKNKAINYNKTFKRRQKAMEDRIKSMKEKGKDKNQKEAKENIMKKMTTGKSAKGKVRGAALSRFYKKSD